jgi:transposase
MAIVMGLDQHRAQITAEWVDTVTGEVSRGRIVPADRAGVRKFLARFGGRELEVALEATTGWRFVVEELRRVGAEVHLAEAAQTSALRGTKQHAKNDRADARHLRELLMAGRLPECWIAPGHLLDLRARVRLRHTLVDERVWRFVLSVMPVVHVPSGSGSKPGTGAPLGGRPGRSTVVLSKEGAMSSTHLLLDAADGRRSPATTPGFHAGRAPLQQRPALPR